MSRKPTPDFWFIRYWNNGDKYKARKGDFYTYDEMREKYDRLKHYDNREVIEVFYRVSLAIGDEVGDADTRNLVYEE